MQSFLLEPEKQAIPAYPLSSFGMRIKKSTFVWDGHGKKKLVARETDEETVGLWNRFKALLIYIQGVWEILITRGRGGGARSSSSGIALSAISNPMSSSTPPLSPSSNVGGGEGLSWVDMGDAEYEALLGRAVAEESENRFDF